MVTRILEALAIALMSALVLLVLANALGRYLFAAPLPWTEEVVTTLLVWLAAVGITLGALRRSLICCEIVTRHLAGSARRAFDVFGTVFCVAVVAALGWFTWRYLLVFGGDASPILEIPKGLAIGGLLAGCAGLTLAFLATLRRT